VADGATVVTNQHAGYVGLQAGGYEHIRINHSVGELSATSAHTNGIESFWALLKRGHYGIFHYMKPQAPAPLRQRVRLPPQHRPVRDDRHHRCHDPQDRCS
jgi:hypothetical protein